MIPPFSVHTNWQAQYEQFIGGGSATGLATLMFPGFSNLIVPCTHTEIVGDYNLIPGGLSTTTMIERCEFKVASMNGCVPKKAYNVTLQVSPTVAPISMMLWHGGLQPGGEIYRFMLVGVNYHG